MNIVYAQQDIPEDPGPSIFLVGPTPRDQSVKSWRPDALSYLQETLKFEGTIFAPEFKNPMSDLAGPGFSHDKQIQWEWDALHKASMIAAWVPRRIDQGMPAFTTNVEFGFWLKSGKLAYGRPNSADKIAYLDFMYKKCTGKEPLEKLETLLAYCCILAKACYEFEQAHNEMMAKGPILSYGD